MLTPAFSADFGLKQTASDAGYDLNKTSPADYVELIVSIVLGFGATIFFGLALYGGFIWMMARGNDEKVTLAKGILETAIIGIVIVSSSYAISRFVLSRVSGQTAEEPTGCCTVEGDQTSGVFQRNCSGTWQIGDCS